MKSCYHKYKLLLILLIITPTSSKHYWWENLNYYEILGLEENPQQPQLATNLITSYHPNRRIIKKNLNIYYQRAKKTTQEIKKAYRKEAQKYHPDKARNRKEEYTARFNRIKEAYDVLIDENRRNDYEEELYYEEKVVLQERSQVLNDLELWEERPTNVYERHERGYDHNSNMPILRVHKREEFGRGRYRVWIQDFVHGHPLAPPHIVEENMNMHSDIIPYQLHNGESTKILQSSNELYRAKLTYDCELVIVRKKPLPHLKSKVVWSSRTYLVPKEENEDAPQCSFMFVNRQLIVYASDNEDQSIIWHSIPPHDNHTSSSFLVLENDGVLAIYFHSNSTHQENAFFKPNTTNTQPTKASQLWNTCYQKIQKFPLIDIYSKKTVHVLQPNMKRISNSYHKTILSLQRAVIRLTQSIYHPKADSNLLCIWSTNGCTPFPILRLVRFAFLAVQYQFIRNIQRLIHSISNRRNDYYDEDMNPIEWMSDLGKQIYRWGENTFYDLFGDEDDDDYLDEDEDYMIQVYLRNKMNRWKDVMNDRMDMPF